ncbi:hypothetical protein L249_6467 [Ophiocordyceps polyrhachis-furcata BCC 54312]|uniref:Histone acetyltransferase type B catalytic subunit n=1 Tax=Ophiocordyceps polyrhachis-furcata BCC 54312 TaxID=1330021 RepID=A0A367LLD6_9HYPO|nr:hypothetical protein L249_6467 [Ophiocordyceps polyrhachis-furcata BCC 54312]
MASLPENEDWLSGSNDALSVSLVSPTANGLRQVDKFHPRFTYSIFGDDETIFGYEGLKINLRFRANDMRPHLQIHHDKKLKPLAGQKEPVDVAAVFRDGNHLPQVAFVKESDFEAGSKQLPDDWTPPGTLHATVDATDGQYEIWKGSLADLSVQQLNNRIQILVPLFIEGGTYIGQSPDPNNAEPDLSDADRWTVFLLYKKEKLPDNDEKTSYIFVGFATVYRFFYFQPPAPAAAHSSDWELPKQQMNLADLPCRTRISHFVILPPFQAKGNGSRLYKAIFDHYYHHPQTHELTVENPSEAFDDLRDICDLAFLRTLPEFEELSLDASAKVPESGVLPPLVVGNDKLVSIRKEAKIAPRQFSRVLEMHLMSKLPLSVRPTLDLDADVPSPIKEDKHLEKIWQLFVKQRLYHHNRDALSQIELRERIEKLRETLASVELDYARVTAAHERAMKHSEAQPRLQSNGKRKLDELETETDAASKKPRVESA